MSTLRQQLAEQLTPKLPARKYRVLPALGTIDRLAKPTLQFEQTDIEPAPAAPRGALLVTLRVHVITNLEGVTPAADDSIDLLGVEVFEALAGLGWVNPTIAEKAVWRERHLSYIITCQVLTERK